MSWTNTKNNKDHYIKFKLVIGCFSWCKCFYVMSNFEDWENIIHFGNFFGSIGKKTYFLALGTTPVKGVGFIAGKITAVLLPWIVSNNLLGVGGGLVALHVLRHKPRPQHLQRKQ